MTAWPRLDQLDRASVEAQHFRLVEHSRLVEGGVDPLGLRQVNLDLMATALPGINNVTSRIRPYAFMAWAWWRAVQSISDGGRRVVQAADLQDRVDRWEVLLAWSHVLSSADSELPGRNVLSKNLPRATAPYRFHGPTWDQFRASRRNSTALMAAIQYGPSIKALGWLIPQDNRTFAPSDQAMPAVKSIDSLVNSALSSEILSSADVSVTPEQARLFYETWSVASPTDAEQSAFRNLFFDAGLDPRAGQDAARRRRTLALLDTIFRQEGAHLQEMDIRRVLASGRLTSGDLIGSSANHNDSLLLWSALQARQLQRLSLEAMLVWIEAQIRSHENAVDAEVLAEQADVDARIVEDGADSATVGAYFGYAAARGAPLGWPAACAHSAGTDIFSLMDELFAAQRDLRFEQIPGLALRGLAYAEAMAAGLRANGVDPSARGLLGGNSDRLPLNAASRRLDLLRYRPMRDLWREIILSWVLAQHVRWSVARNGDGTQRLRIALDEGGWTCLRIGSSGPFGPTPDRLGAALALSADCGLFAVEKSADGRRAYGPGD